MIANQGSAVGLAKRPAKRQVIKPKLLNLRTLAKALGVSYYTLLGYRRAGVLGEGRLYEVEDAKGRIAASTIVPWHFMRKGWRNEPKLDPKRWATGEPPTFKDLVRKASSQVGTGA